MNTFKNITIIAIVVFLSSVSLAQQGKVTLNITDQNFISGDTYEFYIVLYDCSSGTPSPLAYIGPTSSGPVSSMPFIWGPNNFPYNIGGDYSKIFKFRAVVYKTSVTPQIQRETWTDLFDTYDYLLGVTVTVPF